MKTSILAAAAALALSGFASASQITFTNNSGIYSADGVTVTVAATGGSRYYSSVESGGIAGTGSLGVGSSATTAGIGCANSFPTCALVFTGWTTSEWLTFTFSEAVKLSSIGFTQWENSVLNIGDWARLTYYVGNSNTVAGTVDFVNSGIGDGPLLDTFATGALANLAVTKFMVSPLQGTKPNGVSAKTAFYVHDLNFSKIPTVPVPGAAWLMGSALVGLAGVARRRAA
jgi:hypothetical protein